MNTDKFNKIIEEQIERSTSTLVKKAAEYATEDRLHNFRIAAKLQDISPMQALQGMMAKHTVSVYDMMSHIDIRDFPLEMWREKVTDHINYLLLATALIDEAYGSHIANEEAKERVAKRNEAELQALRDKLTYVEPNQSSPEDLSELILVQLQYMLNVYPQSPIEGDLQTFQSWVQDVLAGKADVSDMEQLHKRRIESILNYTERLPTERQKYDLKPLRDFLKANLVQMRIE